MSSTEMIVYPGNNLPGYNFFKHHKLRRRGAKRFTAASNYILPVTRTTQALLRLTAASFSHFNIQARERLTAVSILRQSV